VTAVKVKICGMMRAADVAAAIAAGVDALGFVFVPASKRCLDHTLAARLCRLVPAFITRVGLFLDQPADDIRQVLDQVPLNLLQFHGRESPEFCRQFGLPYIKAIAVEDSNSIHCAERKFYDAAGILVDSHQPGAMGGTGKTVDWGKVCPGERPWILAGGLTPDNVAEAVHRLRPWAVDVATGVEQSPGVKDEVAMKRFIQEAKCER